MYIIYIYVYIYIYVCVCVCVCVYIMFLELLFHISAEKAFCLLCVSISLYQYSSLKCITH